MKSLSRIRVTKTDCGYILRERVMNLLLHLPISLLMSVGGVYYLYCLSRERDGQQMLNGILGLVLLGTGLFFLVALTGQKLVLDEFGVRHYVWGIPVRRMSWEQVVSFGVRKYTGHSARYGDSSYYYLYFSPFRRKTSGWRCLRLEVSQKDYKEFRGSPLQAYIKRRKGDVTSDE
jgi:hypothetical protein